MQRDMRTRAASMETRPWVISASRQRLTSATGRTEPSARDSRSAGSKISGKGSLMPGSVFASAPAQDPHKFQQDGFAGQLG